MKKKYKFGKVQIKKIEKDEEVEVTAKLIEGGPGPSPKAEVMVGPSPKAESPKAEKGAEKLEPKAEKAEY